jgi:16S rRNA (guanine527-N7)-methyltransferase
MNKFELLKSEAKTIFDVSLTEAQMLDLHNYADLLSTWIEHTNLTAIRDDEGIRVKHFLDSISCIPAMNLSGTEKIIDVGTGAGFPGLVLKILFPDIQLTLVESVGKKTKFLSHVVEELALDDVTVITDRAEAVGQDFAHREKYDWSIARAVARLPILLEYLLPLTKVGGTVLAQKGGTATLEIEDSEYAINLLGGKLTEKTQIHIPELEGERFLIKVAKIKPTPKKYPRHVGTPKKNPL